MFPIRLETQEGLIDQLVQIKMFGLPDNYLDLYRSQIQSVTREQIQEVANKYVRPDEAAIVIVGDGAQLTEQIRPYAEEFSSTTRRERRRAKATRRQNLLPFTLENGLYKLTRRSARAFPQL